MNDLDSNIVEIYQRHARAWVDARLQAKTLQERDWLDRFCRIVPQSGSVLDLGCGAGAPIAEHLCEKGYSITGVDSSPQMATMFQARLPREKILVADMRELSLDRLFEGIIAWDSFFHLNHDDQRRMFPIFRLHAASRAALMFTSGTEYGEAIGSLEGEALYHASLNTEEYRQLLDDEGFDVVTIVVEDPTCGGHTVWLAQLR